MSTVKTTRETLYEIALILVISAVIFLAGWSIQLAFL